MKIQVQFKFNSSSIQVQLNFIALNLNFIELNIATIGLPYMDMHLIVFFPSLRWLQPAKLYVLENNTDTNKSKVKFSCCCLIAY